MSDAIEQAFHVAELQARLARALRLLRVAEWGGLESRDVESLNYSLCCPICYGWDPRMDSLTAMEEWLVDWNAQPEEHYGPARTIGHAPDCPLDALLKGRE